MPDQRPNIVLLCGEDTGLHLGCYGHGCATTPNLDRLAGEGARYTNAFSCAPVCAPSRSSLVTGRYPWSIGTHHMRSVLRRPPRLFTQELRDAGYRVAWPTKTDFNFEPPGGFADTTEDWIGEALSGKPQGPFFGFMNFDITHESGVWDVPNWLADDFASRTAGLPDALRHDPARVDVPAYLPDNEVTRRDLARYFDCLALQDIRVGRVLEAIDRSPMAENTVVIYLADHGRGLPREKRWVYDAGVHLPLIVRWPGRIEPGAVCDALVSWVDVPATMLSLAGVGVPGDYDGRVFLGDDRAAPREYVFAGRDRMDCAFDRVRAVRSGRYLYVRNFWPDLPYAQCQPYMEQEPTLAEMRRLHAAGELDGPAALFMAERKPVEELYDCEADRDNVHNLADDPAHGAALAEHRAALDRHLDEAGDLGAVPERELVRRGLVTDYAETEHRPRLAALPEAVRVGAFRALLTEEEARAYVDSLPTPTLHHAAVTYRTPTAPPNV